jgi:hypothetical protein
MEGLGSEWILGRLVGWVWIGFSWLRTGTGGWLLWIRWWTWGFWRHGVSHTVAALSLLQRNGVGSSHSFVMDSGLWGKSICTGNFESWIRSSWDAQERNYYVTYTRGTHFRENRSKFKLCKLHCEPASSVSIVFGYGLDDRAIGVRSPAGAKDFSFILCVQTGCGAHPASCTIGIGGPFRGGKARPGRYIDHSPPSSTGARISRSHNSSLPKRLYGV